jgi:hypothetical protein
MIRHSGYMKENKNTGEQVRRLKTGDLFLIIKKKISRRKLIKKK